MARCVPTEIALEPLDLILNSQAFRYSAGSLPFFVAGFLTLALGLWVFWRERTHRAGYLFLGICLFLTVWGLLRGALRMAVDPDIAAGLGRYLYATLTLLAPLTFEYNLTQMRRERQWRVVLRSNWIVGIALALVCAGTPLIVQEARMQPWGLEPQAGWLGIVLCVWVGWMFLFADLEMLRAVKASSPYSRERQRLILIGWGLAILHLGVLELAVFYGLPFYPATYLVVLAYPAIHTVAILRFGLTDVSPSSLAEQIVGVMRGALLVLESDGHISFANPSSRKLLGRTQNALLGKPISEVLGPELDAELLGLLAADEETERELFYRASEGAPEQQLSMSVVRAKDSQQRQVGWILYLRDITASQRHEQQRMDETLRDPLTGLPSRISFMGLLDAAAQSVAGGSGLRFGVCCIGIDRFHVVNEDLGQRVGDQVLIEFAQLLRDRLRPQDVVCRLGGDEFAVLVTNADEQRPEREFAEQLMQALKLPLKIAGHSIYLSVSVGVVSSEAQLEEGGDVLRHAGIAMHRIKERGGGNVEYISELTGARQRTRLEAELRGAVERREFVVYYQPVIDAQEEKIVGFEALVRWLHPQEGLLLPGRFIEFAEEIGLAPQIDRLVMEQACKDICAFRATEHGSQVTLNVNVDESELMRPDFVQDISALVDSSSAQAQWLYLEILERSSLTQGGLDRLQGLADAGFRLCVDDFGTGYSSLSRLHELPIGTLKIDRSFVRSMLLSDGGQKVVRAIVLLAQTMDLRLVAEGVSAIEELRLLRSMGCRLYQGFYYSPAVPRDQALQWLQQGICPLADEPSKAG